jgi:NhaP-type Na+/H+ or K+/H+ antiporter
MKNLLREIHREPLFQILSGIALIVGIGSGWIVHLMFPNVSLLAAVFGGALLCGGITQPVLTVRYAVTFVREVADDILEEAENDPVQKP